MQPWILRGNPEIRDEPVRGHDSPAMLRSSHTTHTERTRVSMEIHKDTHCIYFHTKASNRIKYWKDADRSPAASKYIQVAHTCHVSFALVHEHRAAEQRKKNNEMITFFNTIIRRLRTANNYYYYCYYYHDPLDKFRRCIVIYFV